MIYQNPPISRFLRRGRWDGGSDLLPSQHSDQGYTIHGAIRQELQDGRRGGSILNLGCGREKKVAERYLLDIFVVGCNIHDGTGKWKDVGFI